MGCTGDSHIALVRDCGVGCFMSMSPYLMTWIASRPVLGRKADSQAC
jgi:hypothetical protein